LNIRQLLLIIACLLMPLQAVRAHEGESPAGSHSPAAAAPGRLEERLGEKIPLTPLFTDSDGQQVLLSELIDRPTLVVPVYYQCRNVCNFLLGGLAWVLPQLKLEPGEDYNVITFSIDPDEPSALAEHSKKTFFSALQAPFPPNAWRFLTGDQANIRQVTDAAGYYFSKSGADFLHPVVAFVVSKEGKIVRYLPGQNFSPLDLTMALVEASEDRIGLPIRKALQFCFSYDPAGRKYVFNLLRVSGTVILLTLGTFLLYLVFGSRRKKP
jgi:protein SCO1/2